jgi:hypothetical protein
MGWLLASIDFTLLLRVPGWQRLRTWEIAADWMQLYYGPSQVLIYGILAKILERHGAIFHSHTPVTGYTGELAR